MLKLASFENGAEFHFPPPSYSEREPEIEGCEDEETRKIVDSTKWSARKVSHRAIHHCQQRGCREQMELERQLWQLPRGNPRFYMHSLISLSEIYGGRGLRHFSYREYDALFNCLLSRNCLLSLRFFPPPAILFCLYFSFFSSSPIYNSTL